MKLNKLFASLLMIAAVAFAACTKTPNEPDGPVGPGGGEDTPATVSDTLTVAQAVATQDGSVAYVKGYIVGWYSNHNNDKKAIFSAEATADTTVTATNVVIADATTETTQANCVCVQLPVGALRSALNLLDNPGNLHAAVVLHGTLTAYNTMAGLKTIDAASLNGTEISTSVDVDDAITATCAEAAAAASALAAGASSTEYYKVSGTVSAVATAAANLVSYGNINFTLQDETGVIGCYYINYLNNEKFTSADQILNPGDKVTVVSQLKNYVKSGATEGTPELANGFLLTIEKGEVSDEITNKTLAEIIAIAQGEASGATTLEKYRSTGVVSKVSTAVDKLVGYGNCNFQITDGTNTVTCYYTNYLDNAAFTSTDQIPVVGDTVTVVGPVQNYNGTAEFYKGYIEVIKRGNGTTPTPDPTPTTDTTTIDVPDGTQYTIDFSANPLTLSEAVTLKEVTTYTFGELTLSIDPSGNATSGAVISTDLYKMYKSTSFTLTAPAGKNIKYIFIDTPATAAAKYGADLLTLTSTGGSLSVNASYDGTWTGEANAVTMSNTAQVRISKMLVVYE